MNAKLLTGFLVFNSIFLISLPAHAGVIATAVEDRVFVIDSSTAERGITLGSGNNNVTVALPQGSVAPDTKVGIMTFASEYFVTQGSTHRVTPLYRIGFDAPAGVTATPATITVEVRYPQEQLGKKILRAFDEQTGLWSDISSKSIPEHNAVRAQIPEATTYLAVFADDKILETGFASWYNYKNCKCAASPDYPKGTLLTVTNLENGKSVTVRVNDFGPDRVKHPDRVIDLDKKAFAQIAGSKKGLVRVKVERVES